MDMPANKQFRRKQNKAETKNDHKIRSRWGRIQAVQPFVGRPLARKKRESELRIEEEKRLGVKALVVLY